MDLTKTCAACGKKFDIREEDLAFYKKIDVPPPTRCQPCREQNRFVFRNERAIYRRMCDMCKASIISIYSPDKTFPVYCQSCWWGDAWNAEKFGRDFDFNKSFFEQFAELNRAVPRYSLYNVNGLNSDYCHQCVDNKDCYLCFVMKGCDSCLYLFHVYGDRDCVDSTYLRESELCYECIDSQHLYNCTHCEYCMDSSDIYFCYDLASCQNCFGCVGLRHKQYHIFNKPYSKEEYEKTVRSFEINKNVGLEKMQSEFERFKLKFPRRALWNINVENSLGNNVNNTRNCFDCFDGWELQDCAYSTWVFSGKDYYDSYGQGDSELTYECIGDEEVHRCFFTMFVTRSHDVFYSDACFSSSNLFGCTGIKKGEYMILNKKYSREEYEALRDKIIEHMKKNGEWGVFFPASLSPFCYNETIAQDYYPSKIIH